MNIIIALICSVISFISGPVLQHWDIANYFVGVGFWNYFIAVNK